MISYWGIDHGEDVSKAFKMPKMSKLGRKKPAPAPKKSGPEPPELIGGEGQWYYNGKPASKTKEWERIQARKNRAPGAVQFRTGGPQPPPMF